jgi:hypothetical protein
MNKAPLTRSTSKRSWLFLGALILANSAALGFASAILGCGPDDEVAEAETELESGGDGEEAAEEADPGAEAPAAAAAAEAQAPVAEAPAAEGAANPYRTSQHWATAPTRSIIEFLIAGMRNENESLEVGPIGSGEGKLHVTTADGSCRLEVEDSDSVNHRRISFHLILQSDPTSHPLGMQSCTKAWMFLSTIEAEGITASDIEAGYQPNVPFERRSSGNNFRYELAETEMIATLEFPGGAAAP